jgi:hypothetical protein
MQNRAGVTSLLDSWSMEKGDKDLKLLNIYKEFF